MNIQIEGKLNAQNDIVEQILSYRGLTKSWLTANEQDFYDGKLLRNFEKGWQLLNKHKNNKAVIIIDNDADGITSAGVMYLWLKENYPDMKLQYVIAEGKTHGIIPQILPTEPFDLLIIPDASSSEIDKHKVLSEQGVDILILD